MTAILLFIFGVLGSWGIANRVATFIDEQWLLEPQRQKLRERFEAWWYSIAAMRPRWFAVALARAVSNSLEQFFGERLFSKRALWRSSLIATGLLMTSLGLSSIAGIGVNPWKEFDRTLKSISKLQDDETGATSAGDEKRRIEESRARKWLETIAEQYGGAGWRALYGVLFFVVLISSNAISFFVTGAFTRMLLREIVSSGRFLATVALLALNLFVGVAIASLFLIFTTILGSPALWGLAVLLPYLLSQISIYWALLLLSAGGIAAWALGNPFLQIASLIAIVPCMTAGLVCFLSLLALVNRKRFHDLCCAIILRCTDRKPVTFIFGFFGLISVAIAIVCWILQKM